MNPDNTHSRLLAGELKGLRRLDLSCGLEVFPPEIFGLADSLEVLNLSGNRLSQLPGDLHRLHRLRVLFCSENDFTELPAALGACSSLDVVGFKSNRIQQVDASALPPSLRWLILTDNRIESLPAELGRRPRLQKLMLAGNRLQALPESLAGCERLELVRIAANPLPGPPPWLIALPRLAWLAYGGEPPADAGDRVIPDIAWEQLALETVLGEGASGVIHRAVQQQPDGPRPVAVKIFKGAVTSDGWPQDEMAACVAAGLHAQLIGAQGRVTGHPQGRHGLVMPLVDSRYRVLAGPPSLDSCTRDVYREDTAFSPSTALRIALNIASAVAHLHGRGILHGDLYAHNILVSPEGDALLSDFGAASRFSLHPDHGPQARALQRMEARAFGCLLEELVQRCDAPAAHPGLQTMAELRDRCLHADPGARPPFAEIAENLDSASAALAAASPTGAVLRKLEAETGSLEH